MRKDKKRIFALRKEGRTYREIIRETGVSRATLSAWFRNEAWSKQLSAQNGAQYAKNLQERMQKLNMLRALKKQYRDAHIYAEAKREYVQFSKDALFWAGLMLYEGHGDKKSSYALRVSSSDGHAHVLFLDFAKKYLFFEVENLRFEILLRSGEEEESCRGYWKKTLKITDAQFYKTHRITKEKGRDRLQYGIGMSIISSTSLKKKVSEWLLLAQNDIYTHAVMV